jgi:hypothetical protein
MHELSVSKFSCFQEKDYQKKKKKKKGNVGQNYQVHVSELVSERVSSKVEAQAASDHM